MSADPRDALAVGKPHQVGRMEIAQHPGGRGRCRLLQQVAPDQEEFGAQVVGQRDAAIRQVPLQHQRDLDQHGLGIEGRDLIGDVRHQRQRLGQALPVQRGQEVRGDLVALRERRRRIAFDHADAAEILGDQESGVDVGVVNCRRREAKGAQAVGDGDEWFDVLGQMHGGAVGFAVMDRRAVGPLRGIHQDDGRRRRGPAAHRSGSRRRRPCAGARHRHSLMWPGIP